MKTCFKCGAAKPLSDYYTHPRMADGHLNKCKTCAKADVGKHREENLEKVRAYDRSRGNQPHRVEARSEYAKTDAGKASSRQAHIRYIEKRPERRAAQIAAGNAVRDGRLVPWPACAIPSCSAAPEAHHCDYSRPLDVVWLCRHHHKEAHKLGREIERASHVGRNRPGE